MRRTLAAGLVILLSILSLCIDSVAGERAIAEEVELAGKSMESQVPDREVPIDSDVEPQPGFDMILSISGLAIAACLLRMKRNTN